MSIELNDRVAIVTGGANGIGRETALAFARAGAAVAVWDMAEEAGQAVVAEIEQSGGQAAFFKVNVASQADVEAAVAQVIAQFGQIDILINNAGHSARRAVAQSERRPDCRQDERGGF